MNFPITIEGYAHIKSKYTRTWMHRYFTIRNIFLIEYIDISKQKIKRILSLPDSQLRYKNDDNICTIDIIKSNTTYTIKVPANQNWYTTIEKISKLQLPNIKSFEIIKSISSGSYGIIKLVKLISTGELFAMKVIHKISKKMVKFYKNKELGELIHTNNKNLKYVMDEMYCLYEANDCYGTPKLKYAFEDNYSWYLIMEYIEGCDLFDILKCSLISKQDAKTIIASLVKIVESLHIKKIMHRDIKTENIIITSEGKVKLVDFGYAIIGSQSSHMCGTRPYLSPEILDNSVYTNLVDWWCLGVVIYELINGKQPFDSNDTHKMYKNIKTLKYPLPDDLTDEVKSLIKGLLSYSDNRALFIKDIRSHLYFNGIDWNNLPTVNIKYMDVDNRDDIEMDDRDDDELDEYSYDQLIRTIITDPKYVKLKIPINKTRGFGFIKF